jgi:hypothetical protein
MQLAALSLTSSWPLLVSPQAYRPNFQMVWQLSLHTAHNVCNQEADEVLVKNVKKKRG